MTLSLFCRLVAILGKILTQKEVEKLCVKEGAECRKPKVG